MIVATWRLWSTVNLYTELSIVVNNRCTKQDKLEDLNLDRDIAYEEIQHTIRQTEGVAKYLDVKVHLWTDQEQKDFAEVKRKEGSCWYAKGMKINKMEVNV